MTKRIKMLQAKDIQAGDIILFNGYLDQVRKCIYNTEGKLYFIEIRNGEETSYTSFVPHKYFDNSQKNSENLYQYPSCYPEDLPAWKETIGERYSKDFREKIRNQEDLLKFMTSEEARTLISFEDDLIAEFFRKEVERLLKEA